MYQVLSETWRGSAQCIKRLTDNAFIPFDSANTDYSEFKKAVIDGKELQDADGNVMNAEAAKEFVRGLP